MEYFLFFFLPQLALRVVGGGKQTVIYSVCFRKKVPFFFETKLRQKK